MARKRKKYPPLPGVEIKPDGSITIRTKHCTKCGERKNLDDFSPARDMLDGRKSQCKTCDAAYSRDKRERRRARGLCIQTGCPRGAVEGRGGLCDPCADKHRVRSAAYYAERRAAGVCGWSGCRDDAEPSKSLCGKHRALHAARVAAHYADNPEARRESIYAYYARMKARTDEQIEADLAEVLAASEDGLLPCRAGHRAPAEAFVVERRRRSGRGQYCLAHAAEAQRARNTARNLPSWAERDLWRCVFCHGPVEEIEHTVARSVPTGPGDVPRNTAPVCVECNRGAGGKWTTPVEVWLDRLARAGDPRGVRREVWQDWPRVYLTVTEAGDVVDLATGEVVEVAS